MRRKSRKNKDHRELDVFGGRKSGGTLIDIDLDAIEAPPSDLDPVVGPKPVESPDAIPEILDPSEADTPEVVKIPKADPPPPPPVPPVQPTPPVKRSPKPVAVEAPRRFHALGRSR